MLAIACVELFRRVRSRGAAQILARGSLRVALISVTASIAEMLVDLYVLSATDTREQLKALDQQIRSVPAAEQILYGFGTQLVYLGLLVLIIQLAVLKRISMTTLSLVLATLALFIDYELLDGSGRQALMPPAAPTPPLPFHAGDGGGEQRQRQQRPQEGPDACGPGSPIPVRLNPGLRPAGRG
ncbi:hypothetical protein [Nonomuraea sp. SBT364]|uniref:hypothetical protein n=1 Tax=Nonomuraea sp. SBT364 TaxID=1580530 RepID=UPI00066D5602|nr:hypothetical protein [Nonomuraea sp. SBT364]